MLTDFRFSTLAHSLWAAQSSLQCQRTPQVPTDGIGPVCTESVRVKGMWVGGALRVSASLLFPGYITFPPRLSVPGQGVKGQVGGPIHPYVLAFPNFVIENASPLLENASEHTQVAKITVSVSPHASLVGDPVIINANPAVHPFVLSHRSTHLWEVKVKLKPSPLDIQPQEDPAQSSSKNRLDEGFRAYGGDGHSSTSVVHFLAVPEIYILEDTAPGTVIYRAAANDPEDAVLEYFIFPEGSGFTINSIGTISTAAVFDFESGSRSFSLVIKVVDSGGLFTTGNLKIFLINVNNKNPILTCSVTSINSTWHNKVDITLDEEIPIRKMIGVCQATDEDNLGDLTFELDPRNDYFAVDKEHGTVVTVTRLDMERTGFASIQSFSIKACDCDQRCAAILVTAYIHGINDNSPFCDRYLIR
ncbi:hypothetical protein H8959_020957 [Pygathrix nigripes]